MRAALMVLAIGIVVGQIAASGAEDITFDLKAARIVWGADGQWKSLFDKVTQQERLVKPSAVMSLTRGGQAVLAGRLEREGKKLSVWFGTDARPLVFEVNEAPGFVWLKLRDGDLANVTELCIANFTLKRDGTVANGISGMYSDKSGVFLHSLSYEGVANVANVDDGVSYTCIFPGRYDMRQASYALMVAPREELPGAFEAMEMACGLPSPKLSGKWAKLSPDMRRSYLFIFDLSEANVDKVIAYAKRGKFGYIQIGSGDWNETNGTFAINKKNFPHGLPGLKAIVAKLHAAGFKVGLHLLAAGVDPNDPYVTPVPDEGLFMDTQAPLAADVDDKADFIPTTEAPAKFPAEDGGYMGHGSTLRIGDEIVIYRERRLEAPFGFGGCARGALGTKAAAHKQGDPVRHLYKSYGLFLIDADRDLMDRIATRVGQVWNACGCDGIYYDGSELLQSDADHWHYNAKIQMAYYSKFNKKDIYAQGSSWSPYTWHLVGRTASADGFANIKGYLDERSPAFISWYAANFMPLDIGWYSINANIRPDDIEYICSRALGFDASVSIETTVRELEAHPLSGLMLDTIRKYEDFRLAGKCPEALRAKLRIPRNEYRMVTDAGKTKFVPVKYGDWKPIVGAYATPNTLEVKNEHKTTAQMEVDIKVGDTVRPGRGYTAPSAVMLADFETPTSQENATTPQLGGEQFDPKIHGGQATNEGCTMKVELVSDPVKVGKSAVKFEATSTRNDDGGWAVFTVPFARPVDLTGTKGFGLWIYGDGNGQQFKLQPRDPKGWHDYYIPIGWKGWRYVEMTESVNGELDFSKIVSLSFYYNGMPANKTCTLIIDGVKAVKELASTPGLRLMVGEKAWDVRRNLGAGSQLSLRANGELWWFPVQGQGATMLSKAAPLAPVTGTATVTVMPLENEPLANAVEARAALLWPQEAE